MLYSVGSNGVAVHTTVREEHPRGSAANCLAGGQTCQRMVLLTYQFLTNFGYFLTPHDHVFS